MKIPIPSDWDGQTWDCYQVQWPSSPAYRNILLGFLSQMTRGPFWDIKTGWIPDAQAVGWQVWDRNHPLVSCDGTIIPECPPGAQNGTCNAFWEETEEFDMACINLDGLIKIEDGVLYVKDSCCNWVALGTIAKQPASLGDTPLDPDNTGTVTYSACGKATAIVGAIYSVLYETWSSFGDWDYPWQILPNIEKNVGYNLNDKWMAALIVDWLAYGSVVTPTDVFAPGDRQKSICNLVNLFDDDAVGVPDDAAYEQVKAAIHTRNFLYDGLIMTAVACLGRENLNNIAKLGAGDLGLNCDCPETTQEIFANLGLSEDWRYVYDFRTSQHGFTLTDPHTVWTTGLGLWATNLVTGHRADIEATLDFDNIDNGSTLTLVGIVVETIGDDEYDTNPDTGTNITAPITLADMVPITGNAPANAGSFQIVKPCAVPLGATHTLFKVHNFMEHATDVSQKVVAIFFAGSGSGPMNA